MIRNLYSKIVIIPKPNIVVKLEIKLICNFLLQIMEAFISS